MITWLLAESLLAACVLGRGREATGGWEATGRGTAEGASGGCRRGGSRCVPMLQDDMEQSKAAG
jgi:hypothetical protein